jgi:hypothetical protein
MMRNREYQIRVCQECHIMVEGMIASRERIINFGRVVLLQYELNCLRLRAERFVLKNQATQACDHGASTNDLSALNFTNSLLGINAQLGGGGPASC